MQISAKKKDIAQKSYKVIDQKSFFLYGLKKPLQQKQKPHTK